EVGGPARAGGGQRQQAQQQRDAPQQQRQGEPRGVPAGRAAPRPQRQEQERRRQGQLPEREEQQRVEGRVDPQQRRLQQQHGRRRQVRPGRGGLVQRQQGHQAHHRGEGHERERDRVDAHPPRGAQRRQPHGRVHQLRAGPG